MYRINIRVDGAFKYYDFPSVDEAYSFYLSNYATTDDYTYYKNCCGVDLKDVTRADIKDMIFRNVFADVGFCGEV